MEKEELEVTENISIEEDYINTINNLKANTVSKDEYMKLKADNKRLLNSLVNGEKIAAPEPLKDIQQMRKELFCKENSNIDFIKKSLDLREELIKRGEKDPFLPVYLDRQPDMNDIQNAERAAAALKHCVDKADGDSLSFTNELQRILVDPIIPKRK